MDTAPSKGVFSHLDFLEVQARNRKTRPQQWSRVKELKAEVAALRMKREQLKAEIQTHKTLQKLRISMDEQSQVEDMEEEIVNTDLLKLMAEHSHVKDLIYAHHLLGGYDIIKTTYGKVNKVCVTLATAYEGFYLDTYNLEIDLASVLRIGRHNIPPFVPLNSLAEQGNMQTDIKAFLELLSLHLNAYTGRKQQLKLVKEQLESVQVMESNTLCTLLMLMFTASTKKTPVLCTLDYSDHTRTLPTRVLFECEASDLPNSPEWKEHCLLLKETPVHKALMILRNVGDIL